MPTLDVTVAGPSANSYASLEEAATYFDERIPLATPWVASGDASIRALITAARVLDALSVARRTLRITGNDKYYYTNPAWTGAPATTTQRMAWPRTGMYDRNSNAIADNVIPLDLKHAQAELAGQLLIADTTLDNSVSVSGIKSVSAGSVSVSFKDMIERHVLPDLVYELMPDSWLTDPIVESAYPMMFDVVSS